MKDRKSFIDNQIRASYELKRTIAEDAQLTGLIETIAGIAVNVYRCGNKILLAGNGGSAADAQHIETELVNKFLVDRPGLPAIALTTNTSTLSAIGNDFGYEYVFARQIRAYGVKGDMFIGISTSGNALNVIKAFEECKALGVVSVGLTGGTGGKMAPFCDYCIKVPSAETPRIQEAHILIGHILCSVVEQAIFGKDA